MLDLLSKTWRWLVVPLVLLALFLGAYFGFYRSSYKAPPTPKISLENITVPSPSFGAFAEVPPVRQGLLVVDGAHRNDFAQEELTTLLSRVADRGYSIEFIGGVGRYASLGVSERLELLEGKLRQADSFAVILPGAYVQEEVDIVEQFVKKGGKLLLVADPTRDHDINSLAKRFGITFQPDYLYNMAEHGINFTDIFVRDFAADEITQDLGQIALYAAGSIKTAGIPLAFTGASTRSSIAELPGAFSPLARSSDRHVLAIADLTFVIPPLNTILDNDRLVSNIADFLTTSDRRFELADFPHFLKGDADILVGSAALVDVATGLKSLLSTLQVSAEVRGVEDLSRNMVYLGLYENAPDVAPYLDVASIQVGSTLHTPFTPDIPAEGSAIVFLHRSQARDVLVILGHSHRALLDVIAQLESGTFRRGLVSSLVGVYETP